MKLAEYLAIPEASGRRRRRREFAASIGVTPTMITEYCAGRIWPTRPVMERIAVATGYQVMPNDFLQLEAAE